LSNLELRQEEAREILTKAYSENHISLEDFESRLEKVEQAKTMKELRALVDGIEDHELSQSLIPQSNVPSNSKKKKSQVVANIIGDGEYNVVDFHADTVTSIGIIGDQVFDLRQLAYWKDGYKEIQINSVSLIGDTTFLIPENVEFARSIITVLGDIEVDSGRKKKKMKKFKEKNQISEQNLIDSNLKVKVIIKGFKLIGDILIEHTKVRP
jgi:predicted membrane protein